MQNYVTWMIGLYCILLCRPCKTCWEKFVILSSEVNRPLSKVKNKKIRLIKDALGRRTMKDFCIKTKDV